MAQLIGRHPVNRKVAYLITGQGTCLGCRFGPQLGASQRQTIDVSHIDVSLSLPPSPSLKSQKLKLKFTLELALSPLNFFYILLTNVTLNRYTLL